MAQQTTCSTDGFYSKGNFGTLTFSGFRHTIHYNSTNNLPIIFLSMDTPSSSTSPPLQSMSLLSSTDHPPLAINSNLSSAQRKLLHLHYKLGHLNIPCVQQLAQIGVFGSHLKSVGNCDPPVFQACVHGKQHRRPIPYPSSHIDSSHLEPGDCVSGDQVESSTPGLIPVYRGSPSTSCYHLGTLLVDHASRYLYFTPHLSTGCQEALSAKHSFELHASQHNRYVKCYHTDNGIFSSKEFRAHCTQQKQHFRYCGVNAHHQNGIAERNIRSITERARTMLIHAMIKWPDIISENLWPFLSN
jgi:hypothetical protein